MSSESSFLMVTCQVGAEGAVKAELAARWPDFRFAYSRPGFLTFKLPATCAVADDFNLGSVFVRAYAFSLGKVTGSDADEMARGVWQAVAGRTFDALHVWQRDRFAPGEHSYEPAITDEARAAEAAIRRHAPEGAIAKGSTKLPTRPDKLVLDCVLVLPGEWWLGFHRAKQFASRWPGGLSDLALPEKAVSRAYLKMQEGLRWSQLPIKPGHRFVEIGCAPGGACQALLEKGLQVTGIDPAVMDPAVLENPNFTHIRKRALDVRRREFRKTRWLAADMNVAPSYTLDTVEAIVTHPDTNIRGLLLTLKFADWNLAQHVPEYLDRVRSWGFPFVRARQLQHNRQEICVAALKKKPRRPGV
jgi:23S rRNA (cytidine2498-2'-O)-methyltransferase